MGADASIFQLLRQQQAPEGPLDNYAKMMSVKQLMDNSAVNALQRTKMTRDMDRGEAFQSAIADPENQKLPLPDLVRKLQGIDYARGTTLGKTMVETEAAKANLEKTRGELRAQRMTEFRDGLSDITTPEQAVEWKKAQHADPILGPILKQHGITLEQSLADIPTDPAQMPAYLQKNALGMTKFIELNKPTVHNVDAGGKIVEKSYPGLGGPATIVGTTDKTMTPGEVQTGTHQKVIEKQGAARLGIESANLDVHRAQVDPMGILGINKHPSAAAVSGAGLSGDEYLASLPPGVAQQVKALADGKLQISPQMMRSPQGAAMIQMAMQYEPGTDQTVYMSRARTAQDAASGKMATSNNALNTVTGHMAGLLDAADALGNTGLPWANKIKNFALRTVVPGGDAKLNAFNMNLHGVADELERAYRGAGGSEGAIQEWRRNLGDASSPESFRETMAKGAEMLQSKLEANHAQYVQGMHGKPGDFQTITPKAREALNKLRGVTTETAAPGATAPAATPVTQADIDAEMRKRGIKK